MNKLSSTISSEDLTVHTAGCKRASAMGHLFLGHRTMLVNAYLVYNSHMEMNGKTPLGHCEWQKAAVLKLMNPEEYASKIQQ